MNCIDLTGQRFGRLTVIERAGSMEHGGCSRALWRCFCNPAFGGCGAECLVPSTNLKSGGTRSCGCLRREHAAQISKLPRKRRRA